MERRGVQEAAVGPQLVELVALQVQFLDEMTVVDFAVVADRLDDVVGPRFTQFEELADTFLERPGVA